MENRKLFAPATGNERRKEPGKKLIFLELKKTYQKRKKVKFLLHIINQNISCSFIVTKVSVPDTASFTSGMNSLTGIRNS
jgi:hypothetical protein